MKDTPLGHLKPETIEFADKAIKKELLKSEVPHPIERDQTVPLWLLIKSCEVLEEVLEADKEKDHGLAR